MQMARHALLDRAVAMSRRMCALGGEGEWSAVIDLEPQRRELLEQAFATREPVDDDLAAKVREIMELDKGLIHLSEQAREEIAGDLSRASRGKRVTRAYHSAAR